MKNIISHIFTWLYKRRIAYKGELKDSNKEASHAESLLSRGIKNQEGLCISLYSHHNLVADQIRQNKYVTISMAGETMA